MGVKQSLFLLAAMAALLQVSAPALAEENIQSIDAFAERLLHGDLSNTSPDDGGMIRIELPMEVPGTSKAEMDAAFDQVRKAAASMPPIVIPNAVVLPK